jgi:hypothetical protein
MPASLLALCPGQGAAGSPCHCTAQEKEPAHSVAPTLRLMRHSVTWETTHQRPEKQLGSYLANLVLQTTWESLPTLRWPQETLNSLLWTSWPTEQSWRQPGAATYLSPCWPRKEPHSSTHPSSASGRSQVTTLSRWAALPTLPLPWERCQGDTTEIQRVIRCFINNLLANWKI